MPKTGLVSPSMAYETAMLSHYNDEFFVLQRTTTTPDAPFGKSYVAKTQIVVINTGRNSCKMICSVETEFPSGPPLAMGWQIRKGMKDGTSEVFRKMGEAIRFHALKSEPISSSTKDDL